MAIASVRDRAAIVGIGAVDFSVDIGRTEWHTACQAIKRAIEEAGVNIEDIDGMVKSVDDGPDPTYTCKGLGIDNLLYHSEHHWGTSAMMNAVQAVAGGLCNYCVYYQTAHRASGPEKCISDFLVAREFRDDSLDMVRYDFFSPFGLIGEPGYMAMTYRRYVHESGIKPEQLGWVPVVASENATKNPNAIFFDKPIRIDDYLQSKLIADPIRELDCAPKVDGSIAIVITTPERAKSMKNEPAIINSVAAGFALEGQNHTSYTREKITVFPEIDNMARELYRISGMGPKDIKVAMLDDFFSPYIPMQLESLGFCGKGEGPLFVDGGDNIRVGGKIPVNPDGGAIGQGRFVMTRLMEGVKQIRGTSTNQVANADTVLIASGAGGPADGIILRKA